MTAISRRATLATALAVLAAGPAIPPVLAQSPPAQSPPAQSWPGRTVRVVVPFPPGGATDGVARLIAERLAPRLGRPVVVENKPGAATVIGVDAVAKSAPDGHTLLVSGASSFTVVPALRDKLPFDVLKDLAPIALVTYAPLVIVAASSKPYRGLPDLIARAKANPKALTYSTYGPGTAPHLAAELLSHAAGVALEAIPYKGSADAVIGLVRGDIDMGVETLQAVMAHLKSGKLRALAVTGAKRTAFLPDTPGMEDLNLPEAGFEGFYAVAVPAGTPPAVVQRLTREIGEIMATPDVKERCAQLFLEAVSVGPEDMRAVVEADIGRFRELGQRVKISLD